MAWAYCQCHWKARKQGSQSLPQPAVQEHHLLYGYIARLQFHDITHSIDLARPIRCNCSGLRIITAAAGWGARVKKKCGSNV